MPISHIINKFANKNNIARGVTISNSIFTNRKFTTSMINTKGHADTEKGVIIVFKRRFSKIVIANIIAAKKRLDNLVSSIFY